MLIEQMIESNIMNINTNTLLNSLLSNSKMADTLKSTLANLSNSTNGNEDVDIATLAKDKGVQTLLIQLFKDISSGMKNKSDIATLLENSKNSLQFKNITADLKEITKLVQSELKNTPEVDKLVKVLQNSLLDINSIDEKVLKNKLINSGVFLESKLVEQSKSVSQNLNELVKQLNTKLNLLTLVSKDIANSTQMQTNVNSINQNTQDIKIASQVLQTPLKNLDLPDDVKLKLQSSIQTILKTIESSQQPNISIDKSFTILKNALTQIDDLEKNLSSLNVKNEIGLNLKEVVSQVKNNFLLNSFLGLERTVKLIQTQIENLDSKTTLPIKQDIENLASKLKTLNPETIKNQPQISQDNKTIETKIINTKELVVETNRLIEKISNLEIRDLLKNNLGNIKNIQEDIKAVLLQLKEVVEKNNNILDTQPKELKAHIDKLLLQIDYYQLSSFSTNSNNSFINFLQDDIEDVDIKFNNQNEDEFSCVINLTLQHYGDLKILLQLDKKVGLGINIAVEQKEFKEMIQAKLQNLRSKINSIGLALVGLNVFDLADEKKRSSELKGYANTDGLNFGLDIKA